MDSEAANDQSQLVWFIGGSDSCCGAGIQADLLSGHDFSVQVATVVSAVTAQTASSFESIEAVSNEIFSAQIDALAISMAPAVVKIGLLANSAQFSIVAKMLLGIKAQLPEVLVVFDPVVKSSTSGHMQSGVTRADYKVLLPLVDVITPNAHELEFLSDMACDSPSAVLKACAALRHQGVKAVIAKGGHYNFNTAALDLLVGEKNVLLSSPRIQTKHQHGTGCSFASALASMLALSYPLEDAFVVAKAYINQGLSAATGCVSSTGQHRAGSIAHLGWPKSRSFFPQVIESGELAKAYAIPQSARPLPKAEFIDCGAPALGLYPVVDDVLWIEKLLHLGIKTVQLRIKDSKRSDLEAQIKKASALGRQFDARVFINDYWQLAIKHNAYGVHLGQEDIQAADLTEIHAAGLRLGLSTHGYYELLRAHQLRPSYLALGHIFPTTTKDMPSKPQGLRRLNDYAELFNDYPLVAIGGIDASKIPAVVRCGVGSIAVVRAITQATDLQQAVTRLQGLMYDEDIPQSLSSIGS